MNLDRKEFDRQVREAADHMIRMGLMTETQIDGQNWWCLTEAGRAWLAVRMGRMTPEKREALDHQFGRPIDDKENL
jgi:hypothetical protein